MFDPESPVEVVNSRVELKTCREKREINCCFTARAKSVPCPDILTDTVTFVQLKVNDSKETSLSCYTNIKIVEFKASRTSGKDNLLSYIFMTDIHKSCSTCCKPPKAFAKIQLPESALRSAVLSLYLPALYQLVHKSTSNWKDKYWQNAFKWTSLKGPSQYGPQLLFFKYCMTIVSLDMLCMHKP